MHLSAPGTFTLGEVVNKLLIAKELCSTWCRGRRLLEFEEEKFSSLSLVENARNNVLRQIDTADRHLQSAQATRFLSCADDKRISLPAVLL